MITYAVANQKGGVGKTTTTANLGVAMAAQGHRVLLVDADPQGDLTEYLGCENRDDLEISICTLMQKTIDDVPLLPQEGVQHHHEGVDIIPADIELADMDYNLVNVMCRETILRSLLENYEKDYDYCLIDCAPSLGLLTINAMTAADAVIIPAQAQHFAVKGLVSLTRSIYTVKKRINPKLQIKGIVMTMVDRRTNLNNDVMKSVQEGFGQAIRVFDTAIPTSIRMAESTAYGSSGLEYDKHGKATMAYIELAKEVLDNGERTLRRGNAGHAR